jgi:hypothetical protein
VRLWLPTPCMCARHSEADVARHPLAHASTIRVLTVGDMLSHVCRHGHLTLRSVTISMGCRLVTLAPALLVSQARVCSSQPRT